MSQPNITKSMHIQRNPEIVSSEIDDEVVMMSINEGKYYGVDAIGSRIWQLLETPLSVTDLFRQLQTMFDVTETQLESDVLEFLADLENQKLIEISN